MNATSLCQSWKALVFCIVFFVVFILFSFFKTSFYLTDVAVNLWMVTIQTNVATLLAKALSVVFDTILLAIMTLVIAGFLFIKKRKIQSLFLLVGVGGSALFVALLKDFTQVVRPENQLLDLSSYSYPSGHSAGVVIFIGLIVYFVWLNWRSSQRVKFLSSVSFGLMVIFVGFDRVYLNVHWLSDVMGGCLLGAFWLSFCILIYEQLKLTDNFGSKMA